MKKKETETLREILSCINGQSKDYTKEEVFASFYQCIMNNEIFEVTEYCSNPDNVGKDDIYKFKELTSKIFNSASTYAVNLKSELNVACRQFKNAIGRYNNPINISLVDLRAAEEKWDIACNLIKEYRKDMNLMFRWMQSYIRVFENQISKTIIFSWLIRLKKIVEEMEIAK